MPATARAKSATSSSTGAVRAPFLAAFHELFDGETILEAGRRLGVVERSRKLRLPELVQATVLTLTGPPGEQTSIFSSYLTLAGVPVKTSAFYGWFDADFAALLAELAERARAAVRAVEATLPGPQAGSVLDRLGPLRLTDSTAITLSKLARGWAPATSPKRGGIKLHGIVTLDSPVPVALHPGAQREHDSKAFDEAALRSGELLLADLGYLDHAREVRLLRRGVQVLRRLKGSENPRIVEVLRGLADRERCKGMTLTAALESEALRFGETIDLRVELRGDEGAAEQVRVVGVLGPDGETRWYQTSVPETVLSAEEVAEVYALRWEIELLWKAFKSGLGLDRIASWRPSAVLALVNAKVIAMCMARLLQLSAQPACGRHAVTQLAIVLTLARLMPTMTGLLLAAKGLGVEEMERRILLVAETIGRSRRQRRERAKKKSRLSRNETL